MPTATVRNPDANFNSPRRTMKSTGQPGRSSLTQTRLGAPVQVAETIDVRYKKKRPARGRKASRGRAALTIQLDSERPTPRF